MACLAAARAQLARVGVDAPDLDALGRFITEQGWIWRLAGGRNYSRCWGATVAPWVSRDPWAESWGESPALSDIPDVIGSAASDRRSP